MEIEHIKNNFIKYTENYEASGRITLKKEHILRVADNCVDIAKSIGLEEKLINLAYVVGICHDIGRFEQVRMYNTFSDAKTGMDHAAHSNKVLFEDNLIRQFIEDDTYDEIIKKAVFNHNKGSIEENLTDDELLFAKIIRDADKLDILRVITIDRVKDIFWFEEFNGERINKKFVQKFYSKEKLDYKEFDSNIDLIIAYYEYIYDLNFKESYRKILEGNYYEKFNNRIKILYNSKELDQQLDYLLEHTTDYLKRNV